MATQLQIRRGTSTQVAAFTGAEGEIVVNTTNDSVHVNDGSTAGGFELARADFNNISASATLTIGTLNTTNLDLTNLEVTNIKAKDGTAAGSIADSTGVVTLISSSLTTADITTLKIGGTTVTSTAAELNILDGVTSTAAELNILDGVTATTAELNYVDGVTSAIQTQIDAKAPIANPTFTGSFTSPGIDDNADAIAITIDSSENVGIGLTPNTWAVGSALELGFEGNALWGNAADEVIVVQNGYFDGAWKYATTRKATHYSQYDGTHRWFYAPSGTADSAISWNTAMTINNSGSVGIGLSSGISSKLHVNAEMSLGADGDNRAILGYASNAFTIGTRESSTNYFGTVTVTGGNVDIGSAAGSEKLNVAGSITADGYIYPTTDNGWSLGLSTNRWGNVYAYNGNFESTVLIGPGGGVSQLQFFPAFSSGVNLIQNYSGSAYTTEEHRAFDYNFKIANLSSALFINASGGIYSGTTGTSIGSGNIIVNEGVYIGAASGNNQIRSSSAGGGSATLYIGNAAIQVSSDQRLKTNIVDTEMDATAKLNQVRVVDFNWDDPSDTSFNNRNARGKWTGVLAQELVDVLPFAVNAPRNESDLSIDTDSEQKWLVDQAQMVPVLIKAIQELTARIEELENN